MRNKSLVLSALLLLLPQAGEAWISMTPWAGNLYEFQLQGLGSVGHYSKVANSIHHQSSTIGLLQLDLGFTPMEYWDTTLEAEFYRTTQVDWTSLSYAIGIKKQIYDDLIGDPCSLSVIGKIRYAPSRGLDQIASPYSAPMNYSLGASAGREWSSEGSWRVHLYAYVELGQGSQGSPWNYDRIFLSTLLGQVHEISASLDAYLGFGSKKEVNPDNFFGWGKYQHRSSDLRLSYIRHFPVWGEWGVTYTQRLFAFCYPENYWSIEAYYRLPFSPF